MTALLNIIYLGKPMQDNCSGLWICEYAVERDNSGLHFGKARRS